MSTMPQVKNERHSEGGKTRVHRKVWSSPELSNRPTWNLN